jgi:hypothetical protein
MKFFDFKRDEVNEMDYILYHFYEFRESLTFNKLQLRLTDKTKGNTIFTYREDEAKILNYLDALVRYNYLNISIDNYCLLPKGKLLCEHGGLLMLWERQKSQKKSMWVAIFSAVIALLALIANIIFSYYKGC